MSRSVKTAVATGKTLREVVVGSDLMTTKEFDASVKAIDKALKKT